MLQGPPRSTLPLALLALWAAGLLPSARATVPPELCEAEMNKVKDLLQVSCVQKGLSGLPAGLPPATGLLLLSSNRLSRLSLASLQHLSQLSELDLSNNSLHTLETGAPLPNLQVLVLSHNALESLPAFQGLPALTRLALGHNGLARLPEGAFQALGGLQDLQLQGNRLRRLPAGAFRGLVGLKDLDLSDNRLEALPQELLAGLGALEILRLERNFLQNVPDGFFPEENLFAYVYLAENPWHCDCRLAYLRAWIQENEVSIYTRVQGAEKEVTENEPESVACHAPPKEKGRPVMSFQADCRKMGDSGEEGEGETPEPTPHPHPASSTSVMASSTRPAPLSTPHPTTATTTTPTATSPTTITPVTTVPTTAPFLPTTPTMASTSTPAAATTIGTTFAPSTPAPTTPVRPTAPATPLLPVATRSQAAPFSQEATSRPSVTVMPTTITPPPPAPTLTTARPLSTAAPLAPSTTPVETLPGTSAPATASPPPTPPAPETPAPCLCPALPVATHWATHRRQSPLSWAGWLARHCCPLRLALYLACLVLVVLPTLAVLCCFGGLYLRWYRPASRGAPGARLARYRQLQVARRAVAPAPTTYRVCKTFTVGPLRQVSWLFVSLPAPAKQEPWARREGRLSSYSLDRGQDTMGAVRVRYATTASL